MNLLYKIVISRTCKATKHGTIEQIPFIHNLMKAIQCCLIYDCGKQAEQVSAMVLKGNLMA
jgi:hypothetical protein